MKLGRIIIFSVFLLIGCDKESPFQMLTVSFDSQGGSAVAAQTVPFGTLLKEPEVPEKKGAVFEGWFTDKTKGDKWVFLIPVSTDMTLYARWSTGIRVQFDSQGGTPVDETRINAGQPIPRPENPEREGYTFNGWYTQPLGGSLWDFSVPAGASMTLYAHWLQGTLVVFDSMGGSEIAAVPVNKGFPVDRPIDPQRIGYVFLGWYTRAEEGVLWDFSVAVGRSMTLYAYWEKEIYTVSFDSNGGLENYSSQTTDYETLLSEPIPQPSIAGGQFLGWFTSPEGGVRWDFASSYVSADMTLYAQYRFGNCTISFDLQGGNGTAPLPQTVSYGSLIKEPQVPIKDGYAFGGWYTEPLGGVRWDFTIGVSSDMILYAQWGIPFARALTQVKETSARKLDMKIVGPLNKENLSQLATEIKAKTSTEFRLDLSGVTGLTEVAYNCFKQCVNLKDIRLPDTVEIIGNSAFQETGIEKIYFPKSLKKLGDSVYQECSALTRVEIPGGIEQIGANLFYGCKGILSATLPEGMYEIPKTMFHYCTALMTVNIPESVRIIRTSAFADCKSVTSFVLPDLLLYIESSAFSNCAFESISVPDSTYEIGEFTFNGNENLKTVRLGSGLLKIGEGAFLNCPQLTRVTVDALYPPELGYSTSFDKDNENLFFFVPEEALSRYQTGNLWTYYNIKINELN